MLCRIIYRVIKKIIDFLEKRINEGWFITGTLKEDDTGYYLACVVDERVKSMNYIYREMIDLLLSIAYFLRIYRVFRGERFSFWYAYSPEQCMDVIEIHSCESAYKYLAKKSLGISTVEK